MKDSVQKNNQKILILIFSILISLQFNEIKRIGIDKEI